MAVDNSVTQIIVGTVGLLVSTVGFFVVRELRRLDSMADAVGSMRGAVANALESGATVERLKEEYYRFFGERGERATIWARIDRLQKEVDELKRRVEDAPL
jgi:hypothetical protein